ncbi:hypothetical protein KXX57_004408 [Aspergillus fumigatus]|nr:hypothetical protein KXX57_004408 [Aspergillus fumigatus]KAH1971565.1 hypothetical protein KXW88_002780 [Aspergillus fumigatus]KAH2666428.1 hypothetical protein KXV32_006615 [Aspergillus fumigatus]KAH2921276.1 hypothetical protein KXW25_002275 [Aspergillus fumigatus]KAH3003161.1 hypothetical protein KXW60_006302 [Aspergillus fumigatus]
MEASRSSPEGRIPPARAARTVAVEPVNTASSANAIKEATGKSERSDNVMVALSLTPDPPVPPPSRSTFPRAHYRSRSLAEVSGVLPMTRAHSSPGLDSKGRYIFVNGREAPLTQNDNTPRRFLPLQIPSRDSLEARMAPLNISETISEHAELGTTMKSPPHGEPFTTSPVTSHNLRVGRRRPSSPLHFPSATSITQPTSSPSSIHSSPVVLGSKFNEAFPGYSTSSTSSVPSTPTSLRSRSPSISSLETIPDIPDAEDAAIEADRIAALKAAADRADEAEAAANGTRRRGTSDALSPAGSSGSLRGGLGVYGARIDKRKRWSVCGAERRQDLDLETIWED